MTDKPSDPTSCRHCSRPFRFHLGDQAACPYPSNTSFEPAHPESDKHHHGCLCPDCHPDGKPIEPEKKAVKQELPVLWSHRSDHWRDVEFSDLIALAPRLDPEQRQAIADVARPIDPKSRAVLIAAESAVDSEIRAEAAEKSLAEALKLADQAIKQRDIVDAAHMDMAKLAKRAFDERDAAIARAESAEKERDATVKLAEENAELYRDAVRRRDALKDDYDSRIEQIVTLIAERDAAVRDQREAMVERNAAASALWALQEAAGRIMKDFGIESDEDAYGVAHRLEAEAVRLKGERDAAVKRAEEAEGKVAEFLRCAHACDEVDAEIEKLQAELANVAERQREACLSRLQAWGDHRPGLPQSVDDVIRETPLVTSEPAQEKTSVDSAREELPERPVVESEPNSVAPGVKETGRLLDSPIDDEWTDAKCDECVSSLSWEASSRNVYAAIKRRNEALRRMVPAEKLEASEKRIAELEDCFNKSQSQVEECLDLLEPKREEIKRLRAKCSRQRRELRRLNDYARLTHKSQYQTYNERNAARKERDAALAELAELKKRDAPAVCATCGENPAVRNERVECYLTNLTGEELRAAMGISEPAHEPPKCETCGGNGIAKSVCNGVIVSAFACPDCSGGEEGK